MYRKANDLKTSALYKHIETLEYRQPLSPSKTFLLISTLNEAQWFEIV